MKKAMWVAAMIVVAMCIPMFAGTIPYPNVGNISPTNVFTASSTGTITGYFYGYSAGDTDFVGMWDMTTLTFSGWLFENKTTPIAATANFGAVNGGDVLVFELQDVSYPAGGAIYASQPNLSDDGINHAYATPYVSGVPGIPPGIFVGMEDRPYGNSDLDYNDDQFVFVNVSGTTPEPGTLVMLGSGVLALGGALRRKLML